MPRKKKYIFHVYIISSLQSVNLLKMFHEISIFVRKLSNSYDIMTKLEVTMVKKFYSKSKLLDGSS